jgi:type IV secretion system protein VirB10
MNKPFSPRASEPGGPGGEYDARPLVAIHRQDRSAWWFAGGALIAAVLLFSALEARRQASEQAVSASPAPTGYAAPETIPELVVLPAPQEPNSSGFPASWARPGEQRQARTASPAVSRSGTPVSQPAYVPQPYEAMPPYQPPPPMPPPPAGGMDGQSGVAQSPSLAANGSLKAGRVLAGRLENPATTVIQGTLINAVLETALDSTRPGQTRAVVTRDVYGFDGSRLLIPRGSRLYGSYEADIALGQKRAQIRWTRLLRPDGVSIALDSPAADPLGRAGVEGRVNNHFFERFGNALIGTAANVGSTLATQSIGSTPVVVAIPGATPSAGQAAAPASGQFAPTLTVRQGSRVTVFVQHDLDFSSVEEPR